MTGVIYARYSSDNQRKESIEGQLRECKEFAHFFKEIRILKKTCCRCFELSATGCNHLFKWHIYYFVCNFYHTFFKISPAAFIVFIQQPVKTFALFTE